jgi:hypothetical protein
MTGRRASNMKEKSSTTARPLLNSELNVINVGLEIFYNALKLQNIKTLDASWSPPPKLDEETQDLLDKIL